MPTQPADLTTEKMKSGKFFPHSATADPGNLTTGNSWIRNLILRPDLKSVKEFDFLRVSFLSS